jgi:hypothetical protein
MFVIQAELLVLAAVRRGQRISQKYSPSAGVLLRTNPPDALQVKISADYVVGSLIC